MNDDVVRVATLFLLLRYLFEMEEVLNTFPTLKVVWAHAGVSRRVSAPGHHEVRRRRRR